MVKLILIGLACYFFAKYVIEPSPAGPVIAGVLGPIGSTLSGITTGSAV